MKRLYSTLIRKVQNACFSFMLFFTFCLTIVMMMSPFQAICQTTGYWKTIDERDGDTKVIFEIFEQNHKLFGRVIKLHPSAKHTTCERCTGDLKNKPIAGMVIMRDLTITPQGGENGKIFDPSSGRTYNCFIELMSQDKLKLRGYFLVPTIGRTQYLYKVQSI